MKEGLAVFLMVLTEISKVKKKTRGIDLTKAY